MSHRKCGPVRDLTGITITKTFSSRRFITFLVMRNLPIIFKILINLENSSIKIVIRLIYVRLLVFLNNGI